MTTFTSIAAVRKAFPADRIVRIGPAGGREGFVSGYSEGTAFDGSLAWMIRVTDVRTGGTIGIFTPDALTLIGKA